uniref:Uncharacterized protein n=1 Tax=Panagrolaimus sp. JU765 TaxID=591449 RepID=A0AC34Q0K6_9BILA
MFSWIRTLLFLGLFCCHVSCCLRNHNPSEGAIIPVTETPVETSLETLATPAVTSETMTVATSQSTPESSTAATCMMPTNPSTCSATPSSLPTVIMAANGPQMAACTENVCVCPADSTLEKFSYTAVTSTDTNSLVQNSLYSITITCPNACFCDSTGNCWQWSTTTPPQSVQLYSVCEGTVCGMKPVLIGDGSLDFATGVIPDPITFQNQQSNGQYKIITDNVAFPFISEVLCTDNCMFMPCE